jgi:peptidyl-tRNA hydrolase
MTLPQGKVTARVTEESQLLTVARAADNLERCEAKDAKAKCHEVSSNNWC